MSADVAVLVESYNETEHSSVDRLSTALDAARRAAGAYHGDARVVLADSGGNPAVAELVGERFPDVMRIETTTAHYDRAKAEAAAAAGARVVAFLDGDCLPTDDGWLGRLVEPIERGETLAAAGFTQYEGGWFAKVLSVMDFGFLLPRRRREVGCYASNNVAFVADTLASTPPPESTLRCACYAHAQLFERAGQPIELVPDAATFHEQVPFLAERLRRGADLVDAARTDPGLREARWLRLGARAAPLFFYDAFQWDVRRALGSGGDMGLSLAGRIAAVPTMFAVRLVDLVGIVRALRRG